MPNSDNSAPNSERLQVGQHVQLSPIVQIPGILQLSFGRVYEIVNVGRANNPRNDHIYVQNDHGRVVPYLAAVFQRVAKKMFALTDQGIFLAERRIYVNTSGERILILALPDYRVSTATGLTGIVLLDESGFFTEGELFHDFDPALFENID